MKVADVLRQFADANEMDFIVDTSAGLNVDRDDVIADAGKTNDRNCIFLNVIESGSMQVAQYNRKLNVTHNYEIGVLKRCVKETTGEAYYDGIQEVMNISTLLFEILHQEFDIAAASYDTAVDSLDNNNIIVKLNVSIVETINICE